MISPWRNCCTPFFGISSALMSKFVNRGKSKKREKEREREKEKKKGINLWVERWTGTKVKY